MCALWGSRSWAGCSLWAVCLSVDVQSGKETGQHAQNVDDRLFVGGIRLQRQTNWMCLMCTLVMKWYDGKSHGQFYCSTVYCYRKTCVKCCFKTKPLVSESLSTDMSDTDTESWPPHCLSPWIRVSMSSLKYILSALYRSSVHYILKTSFKDTPYAVYFYLH